MNANKIYIIGITGGIGSGKSEAARFLKSLGAVDVDADAISTRLTAPGGEALPAIREAFGDAVFFEDGTFNRGTMAQIIFESAAQKRRLEGILHPLVQRDMMNAVQQAAQDGEKIVLLNVPLLCETGMDALCDEVWVMDADRETRIARVMARNGISREQVEARMSSQMDDEERLSHATRVINTMRPLEKTQAELASVYQQAIKRLEHA